ncbi:MAG TPA: NUDIX pyrophosphatase [Candidatus Saccharimonadales bacterium]|jgi:dATP pyrophosphohydrolase|nr:NUDIX pyrophosphatase [Candidatus Saccharimonadales bacterium]
MQPVIHAELYRIVDGNVEFLLVRRVPDDGGFWQPVTGGVEEGEDVRAAVRREVMEETGVTNILHMSDELHRTTWMMDDHSGYDMVHALHVPHDTQVTLSDEHDDYKWLPLGEALPMLKFDGNRESMRIVHKYILDRKIGATA